MLTSAGKVPLQLCLEEAQPERLTGLWGQPGRKNPVRADLRYRGPEKPKPWSPGLVVA
jgi:hypothetical protein